MMKDLRLDKLQRILEEADHPLSGSFLAKELNVSRQVIVTDIAILRARDVSIVSTPKGYTMEKKGVMEIVRVRHDKQQLQEELNAIVDCGACVENVIVEHGTYGRLKVDLNLRSRRDVRCFLERIQQGKCEPLTTLTNGLHYHTISASEQEILEEVRAVLDKLGFLC